MRHFPSKPPAAVQSKICPSILWAENLSIKSVTVLPAIGRSIEMCANLSHKQ